MTGTVKRFRSKFKYGFIEADTGKNVFFHLGSLKVGVKEGDRVEFDAVPADKGLSAKNLKIIGGDETEKEET